MQQSNNDGRQILALIDSENRRRRRRRGKAREGMDLTASDWVDGAEETVLPFQHFASVKLNLHLAQNRCPHNRAKRM
jgi:hypothetical protein